MANRPWTRDEILLAIDLYCKVPYARLNQIYPEVKTLAKLLDRTPSAVSMRCCNYAQFDPVESKRVKGLSHAAKSDRAIWEEVNADWEQFSIEVSALLARYELKHSTFESAEGSGSLSPIGNDYEVLTRARIGQDFFRKAVLTAYNHCCCVSGICHDALLIASHIKPWKVSDQKTERTNPRNGLCLSPLYDKTFDSGLMTVDEQMRIVFSSEIKQCASPDVVRHFFYQYEGNKLRLPNRFIPDLTFLEYHRRNIFQNKSSLPYEGLLPS